MMSQGTSGDQMWMDYGRPKNDPGSTPTPTRSPRTAYEAYRSIAYRDLGAAGDGRDATHPAPSRPDAARLDLGPADRRRRWGTASRRHLPEVYAKEAIYLHDEPERELKLQAIRIGELGIAAIPNEVFALTGLKIKARSPLAPTMNIELANGSEGYIPPPEQHALGGYTTWPARTAGLEVQAEPKIVAAVLGLLEQVAGSPAAPVEPDRRGAYAEAVLASRPWRTGGSRKWRDPRPRTPRGHGSGRYDGGVAFYLPGPPLPGFRRPGGSTAPYISPGGTWTCSLDVSAEPTASSSGSGTDCPPRPARSRVPWFRAGREVNSSRSEAPKRRLAGSRSPPAMPGDHRSPAQPRYFQDLAPCRPDTLCRKDIDLSGWQDRDRWRRIWSSRRRAAPDRWIGRRSGELRGEGRRGGPLRSRPDRRGGRGALERGFPSGQDLRIGRP